MAALHASLAPKLHTYKCFRRRDNKAVSLFLTTQSYKERLRNELSRKFEFDAQQKSAATQELTQAVPPTETLNSEPQKSRAELASYIAHDIDMT